MTEKRFTTVELPKPNKWGIWYDGAYLSTYQVCTLLNEYVDIKKENEQLKEELEQDDLKNIKKANIKLFKENEQLKKELQRIYDVATLKKARDIVDKIYDDLLYETSEKSDYARNKVLECLEKLDEFGDDFE